jgi:hypothetical protein
VKTQLSQILYTLGGTFTSCACGRQNTLSFGAGEPTRECVFSMMARFVCERSRFVGKPTASLTLSVPVLPPLRPLNGSLKKGSRTPTATTPVMTPKLSLDAAFDRCWGNIDLGPMVGWPDEEDEQSSKVAFPLGAGLGVCALPLPNPLSQNGARRRFIHSGAPSSPIVACRASTPPPTRTSGVDVSPQSHSHSAPPHFASTTSLMARTVASTGSPLVKNHELGLQPVRRGWADVVGLNDPPNNSLLRPRAPSPSPHNVPPSVKNGRGLILGAPSHISKMVLPKLQTGSALIPGLKIQPMPRAPSPVRDSAFGAPLSSSLGLDMESDDMTTEMDLDMSFETASVDSGIGLAEEPRGEASVSITNADGLPVKLPPWARKRVRSTSSIATFSPVHATAPTVPAITGISSSLPALSSMHDALGSPGSEPMTDITEDTEMANGTIAEESPVLERTLFVSRISPSPIFLFSSDAKMLPAELVVDPSAMPPPPIPAALDPTTVTSISIPSTPVIEHDLPSLSAQTPASTLDQSLTSTIDPPAVCLDTALAAQDVTTSALEPSGDESKVQEEPPTAQPPPVRMSFLDWKRKREATQKEKAPEQVSLSPVAAKAQDSADTLLGESARDAEVPEKRPTVTEETPQPIAAPNEFVVARSSDLTVTKLNDAPKSAPPATAEDIVMEEPYEELADAGWSEENCLPTIVETPASSSKPSTAPMPPVAATISSPAEPFSHYSRPESTIASTELKRSMEIDDDIKITSDSETSTRLSTSSSASPPLLHSVSEEDAEDGEIVDSPVELPNNPTGVANVNYPPSLSVKENNKSRGSTPGSSSSRPSPPPRRPFSPGCRRMSPTSRDHDWYGPVPNGNTGRRPKFLGSSSFAPASPADSHASSVSERDREEHRYRGSTATNSPAMYSGSSPGYDSYSRRGGSMPFSSGSDRWYPQRRASPPPRDRDFEHRNNGWSNRGRYQRPYRGRGGGFYSGYRSTPNAPRRGSYEAEDSMKQRSFDSRPRSRSSSMYLPSGVPTIPPTLKPADVS